MVCSYLGRLRHVDVRWWVSACTLYIGSSLSVFSDFGDLHSFIAQVIIILRLLLIILIVLARQIRLILGVLPVILVSGVARSFSRSNHRGWVESLSWASIILLAHILASLNLLRCIVSIVRHSRPRRRH